MWRGNPLERKRQKFKNLTLKTSSERLGLKIVAPTVVINQNLPNIKHESRVYLKSIQITAVEVGGNEVAVFLRLHEDHRAIGSNDLQKLDQLVALAEFGNLSGFKECD